MITKVAENLFVADMEGCGGMENAAYIHACKTPCHQRAVGYEGSLPPDHPNYLSVEGNNSLFLNMIDPPVPLFKPESFLMALIFISKHIKERPVVIHCNQGLSRSPSIAMLYMFRDKEYGEAVEAFKSIFPQYVPGAGIQTFLNENWSKFKMPGQKDLKLHLGCGPIKKDGYINIDFLQVKEGVVDRVFDLEEPLDYPDESVVLIEAYHLFEHLKFSRIEVIIKSWFRVMAPGGKIIMEMPDFDEVVKWYQASPNDNSVIASVFGNQSDKGQYHHWGWNKPRLKLLLEGVGFKNVIFPEPTDYHIQLEPCLRVEAVK